MIKTRQSRIPWPWVIILTATTGGYALVESCSGSALTFTIRKFTGDAAIISILGSINIIFSFMVAPYTSWKSDRIWTSYGRRKPFILIGWFLVVVSMFLIPYASGIWMLIALILIWQFGNDFGYSGTWSPLFYEIVPPAQRGRAVTIKKAFAIIAKLFFSYVLIRQYDNKYAFNVFGIPVSFNGELVVYWTVSFIICLCLLNLAFNVKEVEPPHHLPKERFNPKTFLKEVFSDRQFLYIYLLLFANVSLTAGLGQLGPLLTTEQWGYSKNDLGVIGTLVIILDLTIVFPLAYALYDKFDRFHIFLSGLVLSTILPLVWWFFIKFIAVNQIPSIPWIIAFGVSGTLVDTVAMLALEPYFFDLVPRNKMGSMNSGFMLIKGLLSAPLLIAVGFWVKYYTLFFHGKGASNDYTSGLLYTFVIGVLGCWAGFYFEHMRRKGRIVEYGRLEAHGADIPDTVLPMPKPAPEGKDSPAA